MARRPILLLSLVLLGAAVVQAAIATLAERDEAPQQGEVCTACGPIR